MHILKELFYIVIQTSLFLSIETIISGLVNIVLVYPQNISTPHVLYYFNNILSLIHNSDLLNLIPFELDFTSTTFSNPTILTYEIELPPSGKKIGFNLLDDEDFTIPYFTDTIPNFPAGHKILTQAKINVCIIAINI